MGKEKFDLICSLGGNCAAAHNLLYRGLRNAAYPFDWTYFNSDDAVYVLADEFRTGFKNYMLRENLKELPVNPSHPDRIQYEDTFGKIVWANHFSYKKDREKNYKEVKRKFDKRFKRFIKAVSNSKKILFVFSTDYYIKPDAFGYLLKTLKELYPDKEFYIKVLAFNCEKEENLKDETVEIFYYTRKMNEYDFGKTNQEWSFLDNFKIRKRFFTTPILQTIPIKKGLFINIFPALFRMVSIKIYLFGLRLNIVIGEDKD